MSTIYQLPDSRDVAADIAWHVAEARRLRTLFKALRRLEMERTEQPAIDRCKSEVANG